MTDTVQLVVNEMKLIPQQFRELEPDLYTKRWFDYRRNLPSQATQAFCNEYERLYREQYAKTQDRETARTLIVHGVTKDLFKSPYLLQFWRARQEADRLGCKYSFYIRFVLNRAFERGWRYLPRPNQIFDEDISLDCEVAWLDLKRVTLQLAENPLFLAENYKGYPEQDDYYLYLIQQVLGQHAKDKVLARLVYKDRILPEDFAKEHLGEELLKRAFFAQNCN